MKWIGALLLIGTATLIGFEWSNRLTKRPKQIRQLKSALQILEAEIVYSQAALYDAFQSISEKIPDPMRSFFSNLGEKIQGDSFELFSLWESEANLLLKNSSMGENEKEILMQFGRTLGQHDIDQQRKHIKLAIVHLDRELEDAVDNYHKYGKMAKSLGVLSGIFIVLLLI
ncbi:stage III sporulation protein SpoIIIAB [Oceanobacillus massiliensis]|uniref:stage III sporulation protein SpoIIIAB n=1 Tax=Oceanobacillus massiliensis TaxID=1465765 RepID=UPI000287C8C8|nr:stage III sporulation protein SpoIIIAB [Oceanobacillus massiliensis]